MLGKLLQMVPANFMTLLTATSLLAGSAACGGSTAPTTQQTAKHTAATEGEHVGAGSNTATPSGPVRYAEPKNRSCMFHQGAGGYFSCLSGSDGQCFHFGGVCTPDDACVPDPASGEHRSCENFTEGRCDRLGAACKPEGTCVYDSKEHRYRSCTKTIKGGCQSFGATCEP